MHKAVAQQHLNRDTGVVQVEFRQLASKVATEGVGRADTHMARITALAAVEISLHRIKFAYDAAGVSKKSNPVLGQGKTAGERRSSATRKCASSMLIRLPTIT
jgi:hypothetical protein